MQNTQTFQLFAEIIKVETICERFENIELEGLVLETSNLIKRGEEARVL